MADDPNLVAGLADVALGSGNWHFAIPANVTVAIDDPGFLPQQPFGTTISDANIALLPTFKLVFDLKANGTTTVNILGDGGTESPIPPDAIGFTAHAEIVVINNTGHALDGFRLDLDNTDPRPFNLVPGVIQYGEDVNANYAYFSAIQPVAGETPSLFSPLAGVTTGSPTSTTGAAANTIVFTGAVAAGQSVTTNMLVHNTEITIGSNSFNLSVTTGTTTAPPLSVLDPPVVTPPPPGGTVTPPPPGGTVTPPPPGGTVTPPPPDGTVTPPPPATVANFLISDQTTLVGSTDAGTPYDGPVAGLLNQYIIATSDNINVTAQVPFSFIKTGSGEDAIDVSGVGGNNVLDGSTGSNFLVGGSGQDTFFVDNRDAPSPIWSTVDGFHSGDNATIFGITKADFKIDFIDGVGAVGHTGVTMDFSAAGKPDARMTLAGFTSADMTNGRLSVSFGKTDDLPGLPGSTFMLVHAN